MFLQMCIVQITSFFTSGHNGICVSRLLYLLNPFPCLRRRHHKREKGGEKREKHLLRAANYLLLPLHATPPPLLSSQIPAQPRGKRTKAGPHTHSRDRRPPRPTDPRITVPPPPSSYIRHERNAGKRGGSYLESAEVYGGRHIHSI